MDKSLIVTLLVPTLGPEGQPRDEWHGAFGTGCAVRGDLILTSRHVVRPERRDRRFPIKVRWYDRRDPEDPRSAWDSLAADDDEAIAWAGEGDLDAALIRCPRHPDLKAVGDYRLPVHRPVGGSRWESRGFPLAGVVEGESHPGDFIGEVMSMALSDSLFGLSSQVKTDRQADWGGASGMPVIVGEEILGVVKAVPDNYDNAVLQAVPTFRMRADERFCRLLGCETAPDLLQTAHDLIVDLLKKSDSATRQLKRHLAPDCGDLAPCRKAIAAVALDKPLRELVELALDARDELQAAGDAEGARVIADFALAVLPVRAEPFEIEKVRSPPADGCTLIRLDAHSPTLAEIIMAGADRRGARFRVLRGRKDDPRGEGCLAALLPEGGRDPQGFQRERDFTTEALDVFESSFDDRLEDAFFGHLKCVVQEHWQNPGADLTDEERKRFDEGLAKMILRKLGEQARKRIGGNGRFTYYAVSEIPPDLPPVERQRREDLVQRLKARFPEIVFLCMAPRPKFPWEELEPYGDVKLLSLLQHPPDP